MKKIVTIYHPELKQEMPLLSKIKTEHGHVFYSTFSILDIITRKVAIGDFSAIVEIEKLKLLPFEIVYSNHQLVLHSNGFEIKSKPDLIIFGKTKEALLEISEVRLFLHEVEEFLIESVNFPVIFETTSFIHPDEDIFSIQIGHLTCRGKSHNPASLFLDFSEDYLSAINKYLSEPEYSPNLSFSEINYQDFFAKNPHNKSIELIRPFVRKIISELRQGRLFDDFDLEIQTLAASTLFNTDEICSNESLLRELIEDELTVIENRYERFKGVIPAKDLLLPQGIFREKTRYWLNNGNIFAVPVGKRGVDKTQAVEVEFKLADKQLALDFVECFHYIHNRHDFDYAFGFFIKGDRYPYAISLVEEIAPRLYKKEFLNQAGIDHNRTLDEIRLYSLPWCPMTTSSVLSYKVREFLQTHLPNITHTITAVNRNIFSGTYIHQAGYIPLALKPAKFGFKEFNHNGKMIPYYNGSDPGLERHSVQTLLPTVEYYRPIRESGKEKANNEVFLINYDQYMM